MKKPTFLFGVLTCLLILLPAINSFAGKPLADPRLYITKLEQKPEFVEIAYEITMAGFVELHLFDPEGKKVWIKGRVTDRIGVDKILVPRSPLKSGQRYTYFLRYKGKDYSGSFYAE
ncbi:MAG: hypothetical protein SF052_17215 [Bacteroidia bacterium]|nr:hypothetical protein [Bacteroidia bacterium]